MFALSNSASAEVLPSQHLRIESVDFLRGLVMVIMALDHTRVFLSNAQFAPTDLSQTTPTLFLTRWITHFCAPSFVFLAGTAAFLYGSKGKTNAELSRFLLTRGLWLIFLELTFIRCFGWNMNFNYSSTNAGVIWAIGWSMVALAAFVHFPKWLVAFIGLAMIGCHNLMDDISADNFVSFRWVWAILHDPVNLEWLPGKFFFTQYPLIPWIGVMVCGYIFGAIFQSEQGVRKAVLIRLGIFITLLFLLLRIINLYGDPHSWSGQKNLLFTIFSFVNTEKYPPSFLFLLMTLGPMIFALGCFDRQFGKVGQALITFGRVPLFYYLLHLPLLRIIVIIVAIAKYGTGVFSMKTDEAPPGWGFNLPIIYLIWFGVILLLYPLCRWFAEFKKRKQAVWLSYL